MTATPTKKKLCWNCDGNVPLRAEHCPYCGVYIEQSADGDDIDDEEEEHTPPYVVSVPKKGASVAPAPPYSTPKKSKTPQPPQAQKTAARAATGAVPREGLRKVVLSLVLLICGSVFALFGLVLLLFSDNGVFTLKWNGDHWPFYLGVGAIALVVGWRLVGNLEEPSN